MVEWIWSDGCVHGRYFVASLQANYPLACCHKLTCYSRRDQNPGISVIISATTSLIQ